MSVCAIVTQFFAAVFSLSRFPSPLFINNRLTMDWSILRNYVLVSTLVTSESKHKKLNRSEKTKAKLNDWVFERIFSNNSRKATNRKSIPSRFQVNGTILTSWTVSTSGFFTISVSVCACVRECMRWLVNINYPFKLYAYNYWARVCLFLASNKSEFFSRFFICALRGEGMRVRNLYVQQMQIAQFWLKRVVLYWLASKKGIRCCCFSIVFDQLCQTTAYKCTNKSLFWFFDWKNETNDRNKSFFQQNFLLSNCECAENTVRSIKFNGIGSHQYIAI